MLGAFCADVCKLTVGILCWSKRNSTFIPNMHGVVFLQLASVALIPVKKIVCALKEIMCRLYRKRFISHRFAEAGVVIDCRLRAGAFFSQSISVCFF